MTRRSLTAIAITITSLVGVALATPAEAGPGTTWVDVKVHKKWTKDAKAAINFVDRHTGTRVKYGPCRPGLKCVVIRENPRLPRSWGAATYPGKRAVIYLNPRQRSASSADRFTIVAHEFAHAMGVWNHNPVCSSLMYPQVRCSGRVLPRTFTPSERSILRSN